MNIRQQSGRPVVDDGQQLKPAFTPKDARRPQDAPPSPRQAVGRDVGHWPYTSYLEFASLRTAPSCARLHTKNVLAEWGLSVLSDDAELVASELATNAMFASPALGEDPPLIRLWLLGDALQFVIVVWDGSRRPPVLTRAPLLAERGRGLWLISELASDWGWYGRSDMGGKCVWAQFRKPAAFLA
jgi:anti-sigma regulatory factor (Ser/Thr protein kinase)